MTTPRSDAPSARPSAVLHPITSTAGSPPLRLLGPVRRWNPGDLVLEPDCPLPSTVIGHVDDRTVLLRHVRMCDDHVVAAPVLRVFVDGGRVRSGIDYGDSH